jgi:ribosomal-protein-alanine N-acetyltransferase
MFDKTTKIETTRLVLRAFTEKDRNDIFTIMKDKEMSQYTPDEQWKGLEDADEFLKLVFWLYDLDNETFKYFFAVTDKKSNKLLGICGIGGVEYDRKQNEVFYHIGKSFWGNGYASEAAAAILEYSFKQLNLNKVISVVHKDNIASNRVMEKIGMKKLGVISGLAKEFDEFNGQYLYSLSKEEYINLHKIR